LLLVAYFAARGAVIKTEPSYYKDLLHVAWQYRNVFVADLGKVVLPIRLQVLATQEGILLWPGLIVIVVVLTAVGISIRTPQRASVWLALSLVVLPIAMGVFASDFVLLENRLYLACAGLCIGVGQWLDYAREVGAKSWRYSASLVGVAIVMHAVRAAHYSEQFRDSRTYAQAAIRAAPGNYLAMRLQMAASITGGGGKSRAPTSKAPGPIHDRRPGAKPRAP
jgi:hypothetical protein